MLTLFSIILLTLTLAFIMSIKVYPSNPQEVIAKLKYQEPEGLLIKTKKKVEPTDEAGIIIKGKSDTQRAQEKVFNSDEPVSLGDLLR